MLVANLLGAPGAGKSTGAAYIFSKLKMLGYKVELVTEFAKDKVYEENSEVFKNQAYIFGKQSFKLSRCRDKVDIIITDSPLILSILYNQDPSLGEDFNKVVLNVANSYNNLYYFIDRVKPYHGEGRFQTEKESDLLSERLKSLITKYNISYASVPGKQNGYDDIVDDLVDKLNAEMRI